jgi:hypothetical protein
MRKGKITMAVNFFGVKNFEKIIHMVLILLIFVA